MLAASRARPSEAARISTTPQASDTKNAYWCETPRNLGLTGPAGSASCGLAMFTGLKLAPHAPAGKRQAARTRVVRRYVSGFAQAARAWLAGCAVAHFSRS